MRGARSLAVVWMSMSMLFPLTLAGCGGAAAPTAGRVYALSCGAPSRDGFSHRALTIIDRTERAMWTILRSVAVGGQGPASLSVDPQGRLWVAHHGPDDAPERTVEVFSADGDPLAEITTCLAPHRAVFVGDDGWVACEGNGFVGALVRVSVRTLAADTTLPLSFPDSDAFTVTAAGVLGDVVAVVGQTNAGAGLLFESPSQSLLPAPLMAGPGTNIIDFVPRGSNGVLLNVLSGLVRPPGVVPDALEVTRGFNPAFPAFSLAPLSVVPSPRAGVVVGDALYVHASAADARSALVGRYTWATGVVTTWPSSLPGDVDRMATDGAAILLAHHETSSDATDGLYELDPATGALTLRLALPDASDLVVFPPPRGS